MSRRKRSYGPMRLKVLAAIRRDPRASLRELMSATGLKSPSAVHYHLEKLEDDGEIKRNAYQARSIRVGRYDRAKTRTKKSAAGRKGKILEKGPAGIDAAIWARIEKIGQREDAKKAKHSTDVMGEYRGSQYRVDGLSCTKLG